MKRLFGILALLCLANITYIDETKAQFDSSTTWVEDCVKWKAGPPFEPKEFNTYLSRESNKGYLLNREYKPIFLILTLDDQNLYQFQYTHHKNCLNSQYRNIGIEVKGDSFIGFHDNDLGQPIKSDKAEFILKFDNEIHPKLYTDKPTDYETFGVSAFYFESPELIEKLFTHKKLSILVRLKETGMHEFDFDLKGIHHPVKVSETQ